MAVTIGTMNRTLAPLGVRGGHFNNSGMVTFDNDRIKPLPLRALWHMDIEDVLEYVGNYYES